MAFAAVGLEAGEVEGWPGNLTPEDAALAARHGALSEQGYPEWLGRLLAVRPQETRPALIAAVRQEWARRWGRGDVLNEFSRANTAGDPVITAEIIRLWMSREPASMEKLRHAVAILLQEPLDGRVRRRIAARSLSRFTTHLAAGGVSPESLLDTYHAERHPNQSATIALLGLLLVRKGWASLKIKENNLLSFGCGGQGGSPSTEAFQRLARDNRRKGAH